MKVCGFSFIKNGVIYDYPIVEAITSILPVCDHFVIAVGRSDDTTLELIQSIDSSKIQIINTVWDDTLREGGRVLAVETDKAFQAIAEEYDWCFYIQGDEVVHEIYHDTIRKAMEVYKDRPDIDGLLFDYLHFYGSFDYIATASNWYKHEIRIVKNNKKIYSYRDAQGFRKDDDKKLNVAKIPAYIYHYGWVKPPESMQAKQKTFQKLWHNDEWVAKNVAAKDEFDYSGIDVLERFSGTHPKVMQKRIEHKNWVFTRDLSLNRLSLKDKIKNLLRNYFNLDFSYKNYIIIEQFKSSKKMD